MSMTCPRCQRTFPGQQQCLDCGCRLHFQATGLERTPAPEYGPAQWQHTPWGKILAGLLLAVGLSYGLQQLCAASLLARGGAAISPGVWGTLGGLVLLQLLQGLGLLAGGAVTGAGQPRGMLYGAAVGLCSGAVFLLLQRPFGEGSFELVLLAQPVLHAILGLFGGLLGTVIWKPPPSIPLATGVPPAPPRRSGGRVFAGPIHFTRVAAGACVVVAGVLWSHMILDYLLRASNGTMAVSSHLQARLIGWEIAALATLVGAGLAGATTANGIKQGLCVGIGAAIVIAGIHAGGVGVRLEETVVLLLCVFTLSLGGGWFGGQLFPPLGPPRRRPLSAF